MQNKRGKKIKEVILNQPINSIENDWIGVSTYVDRLDAAVEHGAEIVGVTSDFGSGKSSLLSLYQKRYKNNYRKRIYTVNMWEVLNENSENENEITGHKKKSIKDIHQVFLYHMVNQISANKGSYLSKRLSKNYGLISVQSSSSVRTFMVFLAILSFAVGEGIRRFIDYLPAILDCSELWCNIIEYVAYVIGFIATGIVLWKSDFIFSSTKSEGKREPDENIIIDYYTQEVLYRGFFRHYIFVIEDLDRTDDPAVITDFLKELRKYYLTDYNLKKRLHHNKVTFVVCIKPEAMLKSNSGNDLYNKFFDYIINLPVVSIDNYDAILNGLLCELRDKLISLKLILSESEERSLIKSIKGMQWIIRGKSIDIRKIKNRLNQALTLYESLDTKFPEKGISFEKCAVVIYLMTEYEDDFYNLNTIMIEELISLYSQGKLEEACLSEEWGNVDESFRKEIVSLIESKLIDVNYRTYFYNYPKDSYIYDMNEMLVFNSIYYNEPPKDKKQYQSVIEQVGERVIIEALSKLDMLDIKFPIFIIEYDESFAVMANEFEERMLQIIEELPWDSKNIKRYKEYIGRCFADRKGVRDRVSLLNDLSKVLCDNIDDKTILSDVREEICKAIPGDVLLFSDLYKNDNPMMTVTEVNAINDVFTIMQLINYDSISTETDACIKIHELIMKEESINDDVVKFYLEAENKQGIVTWFDKMSAYCRMNGMIPALFVDRFRNGINENLIEKSDYVELLEQIPEHSLEDIELLSDINWTKRLSNALCQRLYQTEHYVDYICNQMVNDDGQVDFSLQEIRQSMQESAEWIIENANEAWCRIRRIVIADNKLIREYSFLFKGSFPFVSAEEIGCISNYKDALLLFRMRELEEKDLRVVANYFSSVYRNQTETYDIMKYIVSLPMPMAHKLFYLLNRDKFSYMRMSKVHQNEMNKAFYDLFQMEEFPEECIEFMSFVHMDIPMMEKNLYIALNKDEVLRKKYVELINSLSVVSQEIIKNIQLMQTKYGYSEAINEKLFQQRDYETYVVSKTLKNSIFIFEKDKLDEIGETYKYIFNQSNYKVTQNYMMNNLEFMNWLVQEKAYEEADKTIQNYVAARQSSSLLKYVLGHMQEEQIVEYLSEINGFDGHESARFFVQSQDERKNLLVHPGIYNNCYEKLIDSGLKGWYTRIFKAAKKNV